MIYLIYAPSERPLTTSIVDKFSARGYKTSLAPVGLEAGSPEWQAAVRVDLEECQVVLVLLTGTAMRDDTVIWRCKLARELGKKMVPVYMETLVLDYERRQQLHEFLPELLRYQGIGRTRTNEDVLIETVEKLLPQAARLNCFISYSRGDSEFAQKVTARLKAAAVNVWRDVESIPAGANWDREIEKALEHCTHVLLVATPRSVASENVLDEVGFAMNKGKSVIPMLFETCELPLRVHRAQWVDFRGDFEAGIGALLRNLGLDSPSAPSN